MTSIKFKLKTITELIRAELALAGGVCVIAGEIIALGGPPNINVIVIGFLTAFLISASAMFTNDYFDVNVDKINHPERPLPSGRISKQELIILTIVFTFAGLLTSAYIGFSALISAIFIWIIAFLYNWKFKVTGLLGNMMVSLSVAWFFIFGGIVVDGLTNIILWIFVVLAFIFDLAEEIAADAMDIEGDKKRSTKTIALIHGEKYAIRVSIFLFTLFILINLISVLLGWVSFISLFLCL